MRLAKYAWKRSHHYWQPLGFILRRLVTLIQGENRVEENMENFHKFFRRYYQSQLLEDAFAQCKAKGIYEDYVGCL